MTARNIIRARVAAAQLCGYRYPAQARAAGDSASVRLIDAAARVALDNLFTQPKGTAMSLIASLHAQGELDDRQAAVLALTSAGFDGPAAVTLLRRLADKAVADLTLDELGALTLAAGGKVHASYRPWTDDELSMLAGVIVAAGHKMPSMATCRELAHSTGRTVKSIRSQVDRMLALRNRNAAAWSTS